MARLFGAGVANDAFVIGFRIPNLTRGRFGMPALASSFFNVGSLLFGLAAGYWAGIPPIEGMAYGVVFGGAVQLLCQAPLLARCGFSFRPAIDWSHPGLRHIFALMGPA